MKKLFFSTCFAIISCIMSFAQSPIWVVGNQYLQNFYPGPLPTGPSGTNIYEYYQAQETQYASNAYHNPMTGELLFFVVDGFIYDKDGYFVDVMTAGSGSGANFCRGTEEIAIFPDPGSCSRYYIISSAKLFHFAAGNNAQPNEVATISLLDLALDNLAYPGRKGALVNISNFPDSPINSITFSTNPEDEFFCQQKLAQTKIAVSPLRSDGSRLVFFSNSNGIGARVIDQNGVQDLVATNLSFNVALIQGVPFGYDELVRVRGEMELIKLSNGNYRIAVPYIHIDGINGLMIPGGDPVTNITAVNIALFIAELDSDGILIDSTDKRIILEHQTQMNQRPYIHGLEFSPNGEFLYVSHVTTNEFMYPLWFYDFNNPNAGYFGLQDMSIEINEISDFDQSHLELASDGSIYMACQNRMARIASPNSPNTPVWTNNVLSVNSQVTHYGEYPGYNINNHHFMLAKAFKTYSLPDQVDFHNECQINCYSYNCGQNNQEIACCQLYSSANVFNPNELGEDYIVEYNPIYDIQNNGQQFWSPQFNPFNSMNGVVTLDANLVVPPGIDLIVTGMTFKFGPNARLIIARDPNAVVPSAKVKMNDCLLTTNDICGACHLWSGVEVQGHYNIGQSNQSNASQYHPMQGVFEVNTTSIEHAYFGALAGRIVVPDQVGQGFWETFAGGIIIAQGCVFKNNMHDVYFTPYSTDLSRSRMSSTLLVTDNDLRLDPSIEVEHAVLKQIRGVEFNNCVFENSTVVDENDVNRGLGIHSFNSEYSVFGTGSISNSSFRNLRRGILAQNSNSLLPFFVNHSLFDNNFGGVEAISVNGAQVLDCEFKVYKAIPNNFLKTTFGIRLIGSNSYKIENNTFEDAAPNLSILADNYGVIVQSSGPFANFIQRNSFEGLFTGCMAQGVNATNYTLPNPNVRGLQFLCNSFKNNLTHDIWVRDGRIAPWQGACGTIINGLQLLYPAGNKFNTSSNPQWHIRLGTNVPPIRYFYGTGSNEEPTLITQFAVIKTPCSTTLTNCDQGRPGENPGLSEMALIGMRTQLQEQKHLMEQLFDYSDKEQTINQVLSEFMTPQQKRDLLISGTTIISDEVLINYMVSNPLHTMLYQVLIHNSPLSDNVIHHMMEESELTNGMKQQVLFIQNGLPDNESMMNFIQSLERDIMIIERSLVRTYLTDSLGNLSATNAVNMLESNEYKDEIALMNLFYATIAASDISKADSLNTLLKAIFTDPAFAILSDLAVAAIPTDYYTVIHDDSLLIAQLEEMAELLVYPYGYQARAILSGVLGYKFEYSIEDDSENRNAIIPQYTYDGSPIEIIKIFPNPASDHFFIVFDENADVSQSREARVYDLAGNLQFARTFDDNAYVLEINTEHMTKGMYIVVISANGTDIGTYKVALR